MAGILDDKVRLLDSIVTEFGRSKIASGKLKASFYSFSDVGAIYKVTDKFDSGSVSQNSTYRFSLEATNQSNDFITFISDINGNLQTKEFISVGSSSIKIYNGMIITGSVIGNTKIVSNSSEDFIPLFNGLLSQSIVNFENQYIIGSPDLIDNRFNEFLLSNKEITFKVTEQKPIPSQKYSGTQDANINNVESLFVDRKLSHMPNFQYLAPVNKPRLGSAVSLPLGIYPHFGQEPIFSYNDLRRDLKNFEDNGYYQDIFFTETSVPNRIVSQIFEAADGVIRKLDVIDFGIFTMGNSEVTKNEIQKANDEGRTLTTKHVFFIGKVFTDDNGSDSFVRLFTIVLE